MCGAQTRPTPDVTDELAEAVVEEGGSVRRVQRGTGLDGHLAAGTLRFPLPPTGAG